eukprot:806426-Pelagomonas_calceolata.AAC.1
MLGNKGSEIKGATVGMGVVAECCLVPIRAEEFAKVHCGTGHGSWVPVGAHQAEELALRLLDAGNNGLKSKGPTWEWGTAAGCW